MHAHNPHPNRTSRRESPSPHHGARGIISTIAAALLPAATAFAEVMDKEATVTEIWTSTAVLIVFGVFAWRWKHTMPVAALAALYGWLFYSGIFAELADPSVGLHIIAEAGADYPSHARVATLLFVAGNASGLTWAIRHFVRLRSEDRSERRDTHKPIPHH